MKSVPYCPPLIGCGGWPCSCWSLVAGVDSRKQPKHSCRGDGRRDFASFFFKYKKINKSVCWQTDRTPEALLIALLCPFCEAAGSSPSAAIKWNSIFLQFIWKPWLWTVPKGWAQLNSGCEGQTQQAVPLIVATATFNPQGRFVTKWASCEYPLGTTYLKLARVLQATWKAIRE